MEANASVDPHTLTEDAAAKNPDPTTRREAYELDLMEEGDAEARGTRDVGVNEAEPTETS